MFKPTTTIGISLAAIMLIAINAFATSDTLTIIHINDTHSHLLPYNNGNAGGIARAVSVIGAWKQSEPNPILIHSGDFLVGALESNAFWGVPELQILNGLGFDALCLGNHEFDAGPAQLQQILSQANLDSTFSVVSSNARNVDSVAGFAKFVKPYAIVHRGNVTIGIVGLTTPSTNLESNPSPVVIDTDLVGSTMATVQTLRSKGCQVVIVSSHLGLPTDMAIAPYLTGVDAIIGGHSHTMIDTVIMVNNIPIVQAEAFYHYVGKLQLVYDGTKTHVLSYTLQELNASIPPEHITDSIVHQLQLGITAQYTPEIGDPYATIAHACERLAYYPRGFDTLDTPLGNLLTTAMLNDAHVAGADLALEPTGHMAEDLFGGPVAAADLFRIYPYGYDTTDAMGFRLASYQLSGTQLSGAMNALVQFIDPTSAYYEYLIQSSGIDFTIAASSQGLSIASIIIKGKQIEMDSTYTIVSSDRVLGYLEELFQIIPTNINVFPISITKTLENYVVAQGTICPQATAHNRVVAPSAVAELRAGAIVPSSSIAMNYPNPFHASTVIPYHVDRDGDVRLEILDGMGRVVKELANVRQTAGDHFIAWNGKDNFDTVLPTGSYACRLIANGQVAARTMVVVH